MLFLGEMAGIGTSFFWSFTSIYFSEAGKLIGSFNVNKIRLAMAALIYTIILTSLHGSPIPENVNYTQLYWLGLSGLIGLFFGDACGFKALVMIGPRLTTLIYAVTPVITTLIAWIFLGEVLSLYDLAGIAVTISGITWVVAHRKFSRQQVFSTDGDHPDKGSLFKGIMLGLGAALGQAVGLVLAKKGIMFSGSEMNPMDASFIRIIFAMVGIWLLSGMRSNKVTLIEILRNKKAMVYSFGGAVFGPFLGVWSSLIAVKYLETGVASTLNSLTPVMILPILVLYYKQEVPLRAWLGAIIAIAGIAIIFLG